MASDRLAQIPSLINHQIDSRETLATYLSKADTLLQIAMKNDGFLGHPTVILYDYLWILSDIVEQAKEFNEDSLNFLLRNRFGSRVH